MKLDKENYYYYNQNRDYNNINSHEFIEIDLGYTCSKCGIKLSRDFKDNTYYISIENTFGLNKYLTNFEEMFEYLTCGEMILKEIL